LGQPDHDFFFAQSLSRRLATSSVFSEDGSLGEGGFLMYGAHFCSIKIIEDVRKFAAEEKIFEE
jgi:hypothetical protein